MFNTAQADARACPGEGLVVPSCPKQLSSEQTQLTLVQLEAEAADSKFLRNNSGKHVV